MNPVLVCTVMGLALLGMNASAKSKALRAATWSVKTPTATELRARFLALVAAAQTNRTAGSEGGKRAYEWLAAQARAIGGWQVVEEKFTPDVDYATRGYEFDFLPFKGLDPKNAVYRSNKRVLDADLEFAKSLTGKTLSNLVLRKDGSDPAAAKHPLVVSAHFDTITWRREPFQLFPEMKTEGAGANGAAVTALLAIAESLKALKPKRPIELVFTDAGEAFFLGAHAHGLALKNSGAHADVLALDLLGWDSIQKNHVNLYVRSDGQPLAELDRALALAIAKPLILAPLQVALIRMNRDRSENYAYRQAIHTSVLVSLDWEYGFDESHYHTARDTVDFVDWGYTAKITQGLAQAVSDVSAQVERAKPKTSPRR